MAFDLQVFNKQTHLALTETVDQDIEKFNAFFATEFTEEEIKNLNFALQDISKKIGSVRVS